MILQKLIVGALLAVTLTLTPDLAEAAQQPHPVLISRADFVGHCRTKGGSSVDLNVDAVFSVRKGRFVPQRRWLLEDGSQVSVRPVATSGRRILPTTSGARVPVILNYTCTPVKPVRIPKSWSND